MFRWPTVAADPPEMTGLDAPIGAADPPSSKQRRSTYREAVDKVMSLADFERGRTSTGHSKFHLERMALLLQRFNDPHLTTPTIHVAGTKGKGSVAAMMASVLTAGGYRTGLYTSPHLHTVRERIRVNGTPVDEAEFARLVDRSWPAVRDVSATGGYAGVSTFEMMTLMAFLHFREVDADVQVVEVGLGGRLDSTNLVQPMVSVITPISLDHTATLGNTVAEIAAEKAGIVKPGVPVVVSPQPTGSEPALSVIRGTAKRLGAEIVEVEREAAWTPISADRKSQRVILQIHGSSLDLTLPLLGEHQIENAATAVLALKTSCDGRYMPDDENLAAGLAAVDWPGRIEYLAVGEPVDGRVVVVDGAHNSDSIDRLVASVPELRHGRTILVFGAVMGHSASDMFERLSALAPKVIVVRSRHPKAAECANLSALAKAHNLTVLAECEQVSAGMKKALEVASPNNTIVATGSISVAAEAREWAMNIQPECYPYFQRLELSAVEAAG